MTVPESILYFLTLCHQAIYQRNPVEEVIPRLWIGDMTCGSYYPNFDYIIDCTEELDLGCFYGRVPDYRLGLWDVDTPDVELYWKAQYAMLSALPQITPIIDQRLKNGDRVLVHCRAGKQRSATIIAAYLIKYRGQTVDTAINIVKSRAKGCFEPFCNFKWALSQAPF